MPMLLPPAAYLGERLGLIQLMVEHQMVADAEVKRLASTAREFELKAEEQRLAVNAALSQRLIRPESQQP
jgi:hypothetical protein